mgnify:CR=1 FL=1|jgi:hypothetical protein
MYYSNARKTAKNFAVFCILSMKQNKQKKEGRDIEEKEIQNQPPHSGGV